MPQDTMRDFVNQWSATAIDKLNEWTDNNFI